MRPLWNYFDGEPFLDNPNLFINPRRGSGRVRKTRKTRIRRKKAMATRRKRDRFGRFVKSGRVAVAKRGKRRVRRVLAVKRAVLFNPRKTARKRRSYRRNDPARRAVRRYRRNPGFASIFSMNTLQLAAWTGAGFLGTPLVAGFVMGYIPITDPTTRKWAGYAVDIGAAWGLSWGVEKVGGRDAGRAVLIGGIAYVAVSLVRDFAPALFGTTTAPALSAYPGMRHQPLLGRYEPSRPGMGSVITSRTAARLDPANRF